MVRCMFALAALALAASAASARAQVTLDFENLSNPNSFGGNPQGNFVVQKGFTVTATTANNTFGISSIASNGNFIGLNYTGSVALFNANSTGGITTLYQNNPPFPNPATLRCS